MLGPAAICTVVEVVDVEVDSMGVEVATEVEFCRLKLLVVLSRANAVRFWKLSGFRFGMSARTRMAGGVSTNGVGPKKNRNRNSNIGVH